MDISRAVEGVPRVRRHLFDEDPDPQPESTEELNVQIDEDDPEWQAELDKLRRAFIASRAKGLTPTSARGTKGLRDHRSEWAATGA